MILGYKPDELIKLLNNKNAVAAQRARALYSGDQEEETIKYLNDPATGIENWRQKKITPICRNITQHIIDKSGLLFKDGAPSVALAKDGKVDTVATARLWDFVEYYDFADKIQALDKTVRLLQSAMLLIGINDDKQITFDILHHGNSFVVHDEQLKPELLIHKTGNRRYQVITKDFYLTLTDVEGGSVTVSDQVDNPFGVIPIAIFHDRSSPIYGYAHNVDTMLSNFNLTLNKQLSQLNYSLDWANQSTLFTNCALPDDLQLGPGSVVQFDVNNSDVAPYVEYKCPQVDINGINSILTNWVTMVASAYSVRIDSDTSNVTSGFQLIVKETGNLELRKERQRPFEHGFKKTFEIISKMLSVAFGIDFSQFNFVIDIPAPTLPVNEKEIEEIWTVRIKEGRATKKDYLIEVRKMTPEEAEQKLIEIKNEQGGLNVVA